MIEGRGHIDEAAVVGADLAETPLYSNAGRFVRRVVTRSLIAMHARVEQQATVTAECERKPGRGAIDHKGAHLDFGKGAPDTVAVEQRYSRLCRQHQREHALQAADFCSNECANASFEDGSYGIQSYL